MDDGWLRQPHLGAGSLASPGGSVAGLCYGHVFHLSWDRCNVRAVCRREDHNEHKVPNDRRTTVKDGTGGA